MKTIKLFAIFALAITTISAFAQHSVTFTVKKGSGGTTANFVVQRALTTGGPYTTICGGSGQPTCPVPDPVSGTSIYVDTNGLVEGTTYFYVAEASGPGGVSKPSNEVSALIPFLPPGAPSISVPTVPK